jgi:peptidoglycan/LPS O-acetylase OafA/YrhL
MLRASRGSLASDHLDLVRGLAALGVFIGHARNLFLVDYPEVHGKDLVTRALYFSTGLGHQLVMVFFVLSGYFISSTILRDVRRGKWSWGAYLTNRGVRLYIVLVPALLLTVCWDQLGIALTRNGAIYQGVGDQNVVRNVHDTSGLFAFFANLLYLQTLVAPPLGSNSPLWSLSNEFWYYMLLPCLCTCFMRGYAPWKRLTFLGLAVLIGALVHPLLWSFPVWLLGAALSVLPQLKPLTRPLGRSLGAAAATAGFLLCLAWSRAGLFSNDLLADYCIGISFALLMYVILHQTRPSRNGWYHSCAARLAGMSYTLYLAHLPALAFACAVLNRPARWQPDARHLILLGAVCGVVFLYSLVLFSVTESRTDKVRQLVRDGLSSLRTRSRAAKEPARSADGAAA